MQALQLNLLAVAIDPDDTNHTWTTEPIPMNMTAIEHYVKIGLPNCAPPNEYFQKHPELLVDTDKKCLATKWSMTNWLEQGITPTEVEILNNLNIEEAVKKGDISGSSIHFSKLIQEQAKHTPDSLVKILDKGIKFETLIHNAVLQNIRYQFKEETINYYENLAFKQEVTTTIARTLIYYSFNYAKDYGNTENSHSIKVSQLMMKPQYKKHFDFFMNQLYHATVADGTIGDQNGIWSSQYFPEKFYQNIEKLIPQFNSEQKKKALNFFAHGVINDRYEPDNTIIDLFLSSSLSKELSLDVAMNLLPKKITENRDYSMVAKLANFLLDKNQVLGDILIEKLIISFSQHKEEMLSVVAKIPDYTPRTPDYLITELSKYLVDSINDSSNTGHTNHALLTLARLQDNYYSLPEGSLNKILALLASAATSTQNLALDVIGKVSNLTSEQQELLLNYTGEFFIKAKILKILAKHDSSHLDKYNALITEQNKQLLLSSLLEEIDNIPINIDIKFLNQINSFIITLNKNGWPTTILEELIKCITQENIHYLRSALERIVNYHITFDLINKEGDNVIDIITKCPAKTWSKQIKRLYDDSHNYVEKPKKQLLDSIDQLNANTNPSIIQARSEIDKLLGQVTEHDAKFYNTIELSYGGKPKELARKTLYVYLNDNNTTELLWIIKENNEIKSGSFASNHIVNGMINALAYKQPVNQNDLGYLAKATGFYNHWSPEQFAEFRASIKSVNETNIAQVLSVIKHAVYLTTAKEKFEVRTAQTTAVLELFLANNGRLAQIATGEGKSITTAILAALKVFDGRTVDIITSSRTLAEEGYDESKAFFNLLGISSSHNIIDSSDSKPKECYLSDVVYGDAMHFIGDSLSDITGNTRYGRAYDTVIIDEVDSYIIDELMKKIQKSGPIPGFQTLDQLFIYLWGNINQVNSFIYTDENGKDFLIRPTQDHSTDNVTNFDFEKDTTDFELIPLSVSRFELLNSYFDEYLKELTGGNVVSRQVNVAKQLEEFILQHSLLWKDSLFSAMLYKKKIEYCVIAHNVTENGQVVERNLLAPIDYKNSGQIMPQMILSNGLHQFLQVREGLGIRPESLTNIYKSYAGYLIKYVHNIFGLTGTLGTKEHQAFFKEIYGVDSVIIPNYIEKNLVVFPPTIVDSHQEWLDKIASQTIKIAAKDKRAVLIVTETIDNVESIADGLLKLHYPLNKIKYYVSDRDKSLVKSPLKPGDVIIATYYGGRGTDFKLVNELIENGGLHVTLTNYPNSVRNIFQAFGRAGRADNPGSAQLIIYTDPENQAEAKCSTDLSCIDQIHNDKENNDLKQAKSCSLETMLYQDHFFEKYVTLVRKVNSPTGYEIVLAHDENITETAQDKAIYLYLKDGQLFIKVKKPGLTELEVANIDIAKKIEPRLYDHITSILAKHGEINSLGQKDLELIHFFASYNFALAPEIMHRVHGIYKINLPRQHSLMKKEVKYNLNLSQNELIYLEVLAKLEPNYQEPLTPEFVEYVKTKRLLSLWNEDRTMYNKNHEIQQMNEYWGMWLAHNGQEIHKIPCQTESEAGIRETKQKLNEVLAKLDASFAKFSDELLAKAETDKLIENPTYYVRKAYHSLSVSWYLEQFEARLNGYEKEERNAGIEDEYSKIHAKLKKPQQQTKEEYEYVAQRNKAVEYCAKAADLDTKHAWQANHCLAYTTIIRDQNKIGSELNDHNSNLASAVKNSVHTSLIKAVESIENFVLLPYKTQMHYLLATNMAKADSEIILRIYAKYNIYKQMASYMEDLIKQLDKEINSATSKIVLDKTFRFEELVKNKKLDDVEQFLFGNQTNSQNSTIYNNTNNTLGLTATTDLTPLNATQSVFSVFLHSDNNLIKQPRHLNDAIYRDIVMELEILPFGISFVELEEEEDDGFMGAITMVAFAAFSMGIGLSFVASSSIFMQSLGASLVIGGMADLVNLGITLHKGYPISIESYLEAKALSIAISIATAGLVKLGSIAMPGVNFAPTGLPGMENAAGETITSAMYLQKAFLQAATIEALTTGLSKAITKVAKSNDGDIEAEIMAELDHLFEQYQQELIAIFADDQWRGDNADQQQLFNEAQRISRQYARRLHKNSENFARGVAPTAINIGLGGGAAAAAAGIATAVNVGLGMHKLDGMMEHFNTRFGANIASHAASSAHTLAMMQEELRHEFDAAKAGEIIDLLKTSGMVAGDELQIAKCEVIKAVDLQQYNQQREAIYSLCNKIALIHNSQAQRIAAFKSALAKSLHSQSMTTLEGDVIQPFSSFVAQQSSDYVVEKLEKSFAFIKEKIEAGEIQPKPDSLAEQAKLFEEKLKNKSGKVKSNTEEDLVVEKGKEIEAMSAVVENLTDDLSTAEEGIVTKLGKFADASVRWLEQVGYNIDKTFGRMHDDAYSINYESTNNAERAKPLASTHKHEVTGEVLKAAYDVVTEVAHAVADFAYTYNQYVGNAIGQDFGEESVPIQPYQKEFGREFMEAVGAPFRVINSMVYNGLKQTYIDQSLYGNLAVSGFERDMEQEADLGKNFDAGMYKAAKFVQDFLDEHTTPEERGLAEIGGTILGLRASLLKYELKAGKEAMKIDVDGHVHIELPKKPYLKDGYSVTIFDETHPISNINKDIDLPVDLNDAKLRKKFDSKKDVFGCEGLNFNRENAELFKQNILKHIADPNTKVIAGTYRGTEKVIHFYNPKTKINVMKDLGGKYISGWKLGPEQLQYIEVGGNIQ